MATGAHRTKTPPVRELARRISGAAGGEDGSVTTRARSSITKPASFSALSEYVVDSAGRTTKPFPSTTPIPGWISTLSASVTRHWRTAAPDVAISAGVIAKISTVGG